MTEKLPTFFKSPQQIAGLPENSPVLVALSGGADSSLLLNLLARSRKQTEFPLFAAHVNHMIRMDDGEADRDERFCRDLCESLSIPLFVERIDVPELARSNKKSLEEQAREARYGFFARIMKEHGISILATAHNADDNLETQIFNLCRGCGIDGISGIPETRAFSEVNGGVIVRPILASPKSEIIEACRELGISFVTDSTNLESDCTRNAIRNIIVPELERLFGSPQRNAARLSRAAREDNERLNAEANEFVASNAELSVSELSRLHPAIVKRIIRLAFSETSHASLEAVHVESVTSIIKGSKTACVSLPDGKRAVVENGILSFEDDVRGVDPPPPFSLQLKMGFNQIPGGKYTLLIDGRVGEDTITDNDANIYKLYTTVYLKNVKIEELCATSRREGDVIRQGNMTKRIKKLLCDCKVPQGERDLLPIIRRENEALIVPTCAVADSVRARQSDAELTVTVYKISNQQNQ